MVLRISYSFDIGLLSIRNRLREAGKISIGWGKDVKLCRRKALPVTICIYNEILKV